MRRLAMSEISSATRENHRREKGKKLRGGATDSFSSDRAAGCMAEAWFSTEESLTILTVPERLEASTANQLAVTPDNGRFW